MKSVRSGQGKHHIRAIEAQPKGEETPHWDRTRGVSPDTGDAARTPSATTVSPSRVGRFELFSCKWMTTHEALGGSSPVGLNALAHSELI